jgi:PAS domain S-box-containing protein
MAEERSDELMRSLEALPVPAILTELLTHTFVVVNEAAAAVFGSPAAELVGTDVLDRIDPRDRRAARTAYEAIADRVVDGYQAVRRIVKPGGDVVALTVWGRRVEAPGELYGLWVLVPTPGATAGIEMLTMGPAPVVLAVTDHDWQIQYMSADAKLLGAKGSELRGFPLLGLVHPSAASDFLAAASRTGIDRLAVTLLTRMRMGADGWADRYCLIVPICEHQPPRLGVVISEGPSVAADGPLDNLDEQVRNCSVEARAARALEALPSLVRLPEGNELSARQSEIVARLIAGERVPQIARSMFLSATTVRNHLSVIYRKFGVHSQSELLATLLRTVVLHDA